jgi:MurNAc alpha-1-phosphate uridylyltransferase
MKDRNAAKTAMILAAGLGLRMRPVTETLPKPLVEVGGRTLLDRTLDRLDDAGVDKVVVNLHHLGSLIETHLAQRQKPAIEFSPEAELLETGGGVAKALPLLGDEPFWVANGDVLWLDGPGSALGRLATAWDDARMDGLLLLHESVNAYGYQGRGDFLADPLGRLVRRPESQVTPFLFTGVQILHPRLFASAPMGPFSLNHLYDRAIAAGRLYGVVHDGEWFHVGTPEGLIEAEAYLSERYAGRTRR